MYTLVVYVINIKSYFILLCISVCFCKIIKQVGL